MNMPAQPLHVPRVPFDKAADAQAKAEADRKLFRAIGAFLSEHRLDPSPANYLLAHSLIARTSLTAIAAVEEATNGGVRLSQKEADRIVRDSGIALAGADTAEAGNEAIAQAKYHLELIERIVGSTQEQTERYGRELQTSADELTSHSGTGPLENLLSITAQMIERTKEAERQLSRTNEEVQLLRDELANVSEEARTDPLTGLPNRRALEDKCERMLQAGTVFSAAICDVDKFKRINDEHGHAVGDRVLKAVARVLESSCDGHMVARFGGEEFVVLLAGTRASAAAALMNAARCELAARRFRIRETEDDVGLVTLSVGVAEARAGETWTELLDRADTLLYRAKTEGRNRVEIEPVREQPHAG